MGAREDAAWQFSQRLAALHEVGLELSLAKSVDDLCRQAVELGLARLGFDRMGIWFVDPNDPMYMLGSFGIDEQGYLRDERSQRLPVEGNYTWEEVFSGRIPLLYEAEGDWMDDGLNVVGRGEKADTALWDGKKIIGVMAIDNFLSKQPISEHQRELLMLYAQVVGHLVTLKRAEQSEREQRILAEALRDASSALTSTLKSDEVFKRILANVDRVVPFDAVNLMMIEGEMVRITLSQGYSERGMTESIKSGAHPLDAFPSLRQIAETGEAVVVSDTQKSSDWIDTPEAHWIRSYVGAPILIKGEVAGFLNLNSSTPGFFTRTHAERLQAFADQAAIAIHNAHLYVEVQRLAIIDDLTGLYNYRGLSLLGPHEVERAHRFGRPLSALFFDIDHFRDFNNRYSHAVGNLVLRTVADCVCSHMRSVDLVARFGGEEFVILLPETDAEAAFLVAARLRQAVEENRVQTEYGSLGVTISIGVSSLTTDMPDMAALIEAADRAEHIAKDMGRNRVAVAGG